MTIFSKLKIAVFDRSANANEQEIALTAEQRLNRYINGCVEQSSTAVVLIDSQFKVFYLNHSGIKQFAKNIGYYKANASRFNFDDPVGEPIEALFPTFRTMAHNTINKIPMGELELEINKEELKSDLGIDGYMLEIKDRTQLKNNTAILNAMDKSQAVIEFTPEGEILTANSNFTAAMGYSLDEIIGNHHSMFAPCELKGTAEYADFWKRLKAGEFYSDEIRRIKKGGGEIWLSASYNPVFNERGDVVKVIKFATDITKQKQQNNDYAGQIDAIRATQAVIEFHMDGTIITANDGFLQATGYRLDEIQGKHHRIFATKEYAKSAEYHQLWDDLNNGKAFVDEIQRVAKDGSTLWLNASYNPIFDSEGRPFKVVKFATDITERKYLVDNIQSILNKLTEGDLNTSLDVPNDSPFYSIALSMNEFIGNFKNMIAQICESVEATKNASAEIASGNADLSSRTEQQAAGLQQTTATMEELADTIKQTSEKSNEASELAKGASSIAKSGGDLINEVVKNMSSITESADKISEIIGVIDGIAFQTNILALNAAVEAARAGEQGKGFAVVAAEVRTLAQRSANAAKDIKTLISDSVDRIQVGNKLVGNSGETMEKIVTSIRDVTNTMSEIDTASSAQAISISEVTSTIKNMDAMTQQNSALVEEVAASSESMQGQAVALSNVVSRFAI